MSLIIKQLNKFIEDTYIKQIIEEETALMEDLFQTHKNSCEDFVEAFIERVFNSKSYDIGDNDNFRDICCKSIHVLPVLNYIWKYEDDNFGERTFNHLDYLCLTLNYFALIWAYENRHVFEAIYNIYNDKIETI